MEITTSAGALLAGLVTSVHCAGMCGPLICGMGTLAKSEQQRMSATVIYHSCRLFSYAAIGAVCGAIGQQPLRWFFDSPAPGKKGGEGQGAAGGAGSGVHGCVGPILRLERAPGLACWRRDSWV